MEGQVNERIGNVQKFIQVDFVDEYASAVISTDQRTEQRFWNYELRLLLKPPRIRCASRVKQTSRSTVGTPGSGRSRTGSTIGEE